MSKVLSWRGWVLNGRLLLEPRRVHLSMAEHKVMAALVERRLAVGHEGKSKKVAHSPYMSPGDLVRAAGLTNVDALRTAMSELRSAIGKDAVVTSREYGYVLSPADAANQTHPADEMVEHLSAALAAARRLQKSIKEGMV